MNTKIEGMAPGLPRPSSSGSAPAGASRAGAGERSRATSGDDSVRLSGEAAGLASLERSLSEASAIDAAKVASVRAALESGSYKIDPQEIAARLAELERALGV